MHSLIYCLFELPVRRILNSKARTLTTNLPIAVVVAVLILSSVFQQTLSNISNNYVLPVLRNRESVVVVSKENYSGSLGKDSPSFTDGELSRLTNLYGVQTVNSVVPLEGMQAVTQDLVANQDITINNLITISDTTAAKLGAESFRFDDSEPIPIIIGADSLKTLSHLATPYSLSSGEKSTLLEQFQKSGSITEEYSDYAALHTLRGDEFTLQFSQLLYNPVVYLNQAKISPEFDVLPLGLQQKLESELQQSINRYADYDRLVNGITLRFKVAAIDYSANAAAVSIPYQVGAYIYGKLSENFDKADGERLMSGLDQIHISGTTVKNSLVQPVTTSYQGYSGRLDGDLSLNIFIPGMLTQTNDNGIEALYKQPIDLQQQEASTITLLTTGPERTLDITSNISMLGYKKISSRTSVGAITDYQKSVAGILNGLTVLLTLLLGILLIMTWWRLVKNAQHSLGILRMVGLSRYRTIILLVSICWWNLLCGLVIGVLLGSILAILGVWLLSQFTSSDLLPFTSALLQYGEQLKPTMQGILGIDILGFGMALGSAMLASILTTLGIITLKALEAPIQLLKNT